MDVKQLVLGEIALKEGLVSSEQLDECMQIQIDERYARPLGEILIAKGYLPEAKLDDLLARQKELIVEFERTANISGLFGRIAVQRGYITEEQLQDAVRAQLRQHARGFKSKIGQVMIDLAILDIQRFWEVIHAQGDFQCGVCGHTLAKPWFKGTTILCEECKSPAFTVTPDKAGPKPTKRRLRK
jgi:hypothetical protein